ncbi:hypothetical protein [Paenibacillus terrae]|uniref:hypothetical protein n=1 Tax=Paenibacillus terrae TaxID=159743 RepID=UPI0006976DF0|nr:hypothetical protein [Paenibacillus terrae]
MFGTVIRDKYNHKQVREMVEWIDDLCSPNDGIGWSSSGIYCFWDTITKEILYIGLAIDLKIRFMQHNGLTKVEDKAW